MNPITDHGQIRYSYLIKFDYFPLWFSVKVLNQMWIYTAGTKIKMLSKFYNFQKENENVFLLTLKDTFVYQTCYSFFFKWEVSLNNANTPFQLGENI